MHSPAQARVTRYHSVQILNGVSVRSEFERPDWPVPVCRKLGKASSAGVQAIGERFIGIPRGIGSKRAKNHSHRRVT